jgi:ribosomal-protein-serine acetyltransferase
MAELRLPDPPLSDGAVTLRAFTLDDVRWIVDGCRDEMIARFTTVPQPYEESHAREWIGHHADQRARGEALEVAVVAADDGAPLGALGLHHVDWDHLRAEIGYWIGPWARGREAAPRAVRLIAAHAFDVIGLQRVAIGPFQANRASQRVAEKVGATREGVLRSYFRARGEQRDCVMYSLLPYDLLPGGEAP